MNGNAAADGDARQTILGAYVACTSAAAAKGKHDDQTIQLYVHRFSWHLSFAAAVPPAPSSSADRVLDETSARLGLSCYCTAVDASHPRTLTRVHSRALSRCSNHESAYFRDLNLVFRVVLRII